MVKDIFSRWRARPAHYAAYIQHRSCDWKAGVEQGADINIGWVGYCRRGVSRGYYRIEDTAQQKEYSAVVLKAETAELRRTGGYLHRLLLCIA